MTSRSRTRGMTGDSRAERRRIRRGRQPSAQQGQGHGERRYLPVGSTNKFASKAAG